MELIDHRPSSPPCRDGRSYAREIRILRRSMVFAGVEDSTALRRAASRAMIVEVPRKKALGSPQDGFFYVVGSGRLRVARQAGDRSLTTAYLGAGDIFGEDGLWEAGSEQTAVALESVEAVRLPLTAVRDLMAASPSFGSALLMIVGQRRQIAERRIHSILSKSVESRVAEFLLGASERHGIPDSRGTLIGVKFTHQEIAGYVGSTRETVTLVLGDFKRAGLTTTDHRRVVIRDRGGLEARV